ncbi:YajG family lipoprotein [Shewanella sp. Isolate11]|uniref:YajG family lipoprotein n=1 Tax=Shewanella sp. Isolate11 TaxID=2908530 RepID=UPI001EFD581D|nr:YajG family lipoprotein [Shewanella sp. Isolate11]MCG9697381.1 YajG family lipoprotein [Shewanella sp. Isolate11]
MKPIIPLLISAVVLCGCATQTPTHMALNPQTPAITTLAAQATPIAIEMIDTRPANFVARFDQGSDAAKLVSPSEAPRQQLDQVFRQGFTKAGYVIDPSSPQHIQIQLEKLLTDVKDAALSYEAKNEIIINVIASNKVRTFTKRYTGHNQVSGPFNSDFATLELAMNNLLNDLTSKIINDPELNQFIQE